ncbi:MAG: hypothetical protein AB7U76_26140 [Pirellulales bacterium]
MKTRLIAAAIGLGLIFGAALALPGPTAQAAGCTYARVLVYNSPSMSSHSIGFSLVGQSSTSLKTYERLESGVPVVTVVTTNSSYTFSGQTNTLGSYGDAPLTPDTTYRVTAPGCVRTIDPPDGVPGMSYSNKLI